MAVDPVPYVVHGAKHSADVFRQAHFDATSGAEGISLPLNLRVRATGTPSNQVRVSPGGATVLNSYQGGDGQSYSFRNASETLVDVPASDSTGAKSYHIIARVEDPQFGGQAPSNPVVGPYSFLECVSQSASVPHPHLVLADVVVPASTATVTAAMITDRRELANPRSKSVVVSRPAVTGDGGLELRAGTAFPEGEWFPNIGGNDGTGRYSIPVPSWATKMQIRCEWLSINYKQNPGYGLYWVTFGPNGSTPTPTWYTQAFGWNSDGATSTTNWILEQEVNVRSEWRGTVQNFYPRATRKASGGYVGLTSSGGMVFGIRFLEEAEL